MNKFENIADENRTAVMKGYILDPIWHTSSFHFTLNILMQKEFKEL